MTTTRIRISLSNDSINKMLEEVKAELSISTQEDFSQSTLYSVSGLWVNVSRKRTFSDRPWPSYSEVEIYPKRPTTSDAIRAEITRLEGELSRFEGEPLWIWEGREGGFTHRSEVDIPAGGALLDYEVCDQPEYAWRKWYPSLEAAKAALVLLWRENHGDLANSGLYLDADPIRAYITRRDRPTLAIP